MGRWSRTSNERTEAERPGVLDDLLDHLALDEGQPLFPSEAGIGELVLIEPELVENSGSSKRGLRILIFD